MLTMAQGMAQGGDVDHHSGILGILGILLKYSFITLFKALLEVLGLG